MGGNLQQAVYIKICAYLNLNADLAQSPESRERYGKLSGYAHLDTDISEYRKIKAVPVALDQLVFVHTELFIL